MLILLATLALAGAPPDRPAATAPSPGDCPVAAPAAGSCVAVAVPPADLADLLNDRRWALEMHDAWPVDESGLQAQLDERNAKIAVLSKRPPIGVGVAIGAGGAAVVAVAIVEVARVLVGAK